MRIFFKPSCPSCIKTIRNYHFWVLRSLCTKVSLMFFLRFRASRIVPQEMSRKISDWTYSNIYFFRYKLSNSFCIKTFLLAVALINKCLFMLMSANKNVLLPKNVCQLLTNKWNIRTRSLVDFSRHLLFYVLWSLEEKKPKTGNTFWPYFVPRAATFQLFILRSISPDEIFPTNCHRHDVKHYASI